MRYEKNKVIPSLYIDDIIRVLTFKDKFVQGCVSSPLASNIYLYEVDLKIGELVKELPNGIYTRYSDDITISSSSKIDEKIKHKIINLLKRKNLCVNERKTYFTSDLNSIRITGLNIVRERLSVGTKYKKDLKNEIYHVLIKNEFDRADYIIGKLMYLKSIEPNYYNFLNLKYSNQSAMLIDRLCNMRKYQVN